MAHHLVTADISIGLQVSGGKRGRPSENRLRKRSVFIRVYFPFDAPLTNSSTWSQLLKISGRWVSRSARNSRCRSWVRRSPDRVATERNTRRISECGTNRTCRGSKHSGRRSRSPRWRGSMRNQKAHHPIMPPHLLCA